MQLLLHFAVKNMTEAWGQKSCQFQYIVQGLNQLQSKWNQTLLRHCGNAKITSEVKQKVMLSLPTQKKVLQCTFNGGKVQGKLMNQVFTVVIRQIRKNQNLTIVCQNLTGMTYFQFFLATMLLHNLKVFRNQYNIICQLFIDTIELIKF